MYWQEKIETISRDELKKIQLKRLKSSLKHAYNNVSMYKKRFDSLGINVDDINSLDDIKSLPFTLKDDLRDNYPFGMFAIPHKDIVRIHASSGTTGKPTVVGYSKNDLDIWSDVVARLVCAAGVTSDDIAQVAFGYGLFTGAFGLHYALEKVGVMVVPTSSGNSEKQIMLMKDFGTTTLISTPSYALYISEVMEKMGIDPRKDLKLKYGLFGAEASSEAMRNEIEKRLGIIAAGNYGLSEIIGPGVSGECLCKCGLHINEDHFYPEIIDIETGEVLPEGEQGELVLTSLTKEALPIIRYKTKDITSLNYEKCECGRTSVRMKKVMGRSDDMLIIRGVNIFPSQIETVLLEIEEIGPHYEIIVTRDDWMDKLEIKVEILDETLLESFRKLEDIQNKIRHKLRTVLMIDAKVVLAEPNSLKRFQGKAERVTDLRNI